MLKNKFIVLPAIIGVLLMSYAIYENINTNKVNTTNNNSNIVTTASYSDNNKNNVSEGKHEEITDENTIKNEFPVKEEIPTTDLGDLKKVSTTATHDADNVNLPQYITNLYRIITQYQSPSGRELIIVQGNAGGVEDGAMPDIANKTGTTIIQGVGAVICEPKGGYTQVTFVKNKKFYNVMGLKMSVDELKKIAESLQ